MLDLKNTKRRSNLDLENILRNNDENFISVTHFNEIE